MRDTPDTRVADPLYTEGIWGPNVLGGLSYRWPFPGGRAAAQSLLLESATDSNKRDWAAALLLGGGLKTRTRLRSAGHISGVKAEGSR